MAINIPVFQARPIDEPGIGDFLNPLMQAVRQKQQSDASESRFVRELQLKHDQLAEQQNYHQKQIAGLLAAQQIKANAPPELSEAQKTRLADANKAKANLQASYKAYDILIKHVKDNKVLTNSPIQSRLTGNQFGGDLVEKMLGGHSDYTVAQNQFNAKVTSVAETLLNAGALPKNIVTVEAAVQAIKGGLQNFAGMDNDQAIQLLKEARDSFLTPMRQRVNRNIWQATNPGAVYPEPPVQQTTPGQGTTQASDSGQGTLAKLQNQRAQQQRQIEMILAKVKKLGG